MAENSMIQMVMLEEYARLLRLIDGIEEELKDLPKGYISKKHIRNNDCYYLQWRDGKKIKSQYICADKLEELQEKVARRKSLKNALGNHKRDKKRLERALGVAFIKQNLSQVIQE